MFRLGMASARALHRHIPSLLVLVATFVAIGIMQWPLVPVLAGAGAAQHRGVVAAKEMPRANAPEIRRCVTIR